MSSTLNKKARKTECIRAMYMGPTTFEGKAVHGVFVAHTRKGEDHVYDQAYLISNEPKQNYQPNQLLQEHIDFLCQYDEKGFPRELKFI